MAVVNYHSANGHYPPAYITDENGTPIHSWRILILPYLDEQALFDKYDFNQPWNSHANMRLATEMPSIYAFHGHCEPGTVTTNYLAVVGQNTIWPGAAQRKTDEVTDEHSSTILLVENAGENVHWMEPRDLHFESMSFKLNDPRGVSSPYDSPAVVMLDNSLRRLEDELPSAVFRALLSVDGGEQLTSTDGAWRLLLDGRKREETEREPTKRH